MYKRFLALVLAVVMCISLLPAGALADELDGMFENTGIVADGQCGDDAYWSLTEGGVLTISGKGAMWDYTDWSDSPWAEYIGNASGNASYDATGGVIITAAVIEDGITTVGEYAFFECNNMTSVSIPDGVTSIGDCAFDRCYDLTSVSIPDSVTSIGGYAFSCCDSLTSVSIPDSVTSIGACAFSYCSRLTSITVDEDNPVYCSKGNCLIEKESKTLLQGCNTSVIPSDGSVTSIDDYAFCYCDSLTSVSIPDSVTSIGDSAFQECTSLTSIEIPSSVTSIGDYAFFACYNLTSVSIPDSVTSIGEGAFESCYGLISVFYSGSEDDWNNIYLYDGNGYLTDAYIHYNVSDPATHCTVSETEAPTCTRAGRSTYTCSCGYSYEADIAALGHDFVDGECTRCGSSDGHVGLGEAKVAVSGGEITYCQFTPEESGLYCFTTSGDYDTVGYLYDNSDNQLVYNDDGGENWNFKIEYFLAAGTTYSIGVRTYGGADALITLSISKEETTCGDNLTWEFADGALIISGTGDMWDYSGDRAPWYSFSSSITSLVLPEGLTGIGGYEFRYCNSLTSITVDEDNPVYCSKGNCLIEKESKTLLQGCNASVIPADGSVTSIGDFAFESCDSLTSVSIPDSVTSIGDYAFYDCDSLTSVSIPDSVTSIGYCAFNGCNQLKYAVFAGNAPATFAEEVFASCSPDFTIYASDEAEGWEVTDASDCYYPEKQVWNDYKILFCEPHEHNYAKAAVKPTATEFGYTEYKCTVCGDTYREDFVDIEGRVCGYCGAEGDNLKWTFDDGVFTVSGSGDMKDYSFWNDGSQAPWTAYKDDIYTLIVEEGVTGIGINAFTMCYNLTSASLPDGLKRISYEAFYNCESLKTITIPASVTSMDEVFVGCYALEYIVFNGDVPSGSAYFGINNDTTICVPADNLSWKNSERYDSWTHTWNGFNIIFGEPHEHEYTQTVIEPTATELGYTEYCCMLCDYSYKGDFKCLDNCLCGMCGENVFWKLKDGTLTVFGSGDVLSADSMYSYRNDVTNAVVEDGVTYFANIFNYCENLQSVTVGSTVTYIDYGAFYDTPSLKWVCFEGSMPEKYDCNFYTNNAVDFMVYLPEGNSSWTESEYYDSEEQTLNGYAASFGEPHFHEFTEKTTAPTNAAPGYTERTCSVCGFSYRDEYVDMYDRPCGECGRNTFWIFDSAEATLTVAGNGRMNDYDGWNNAAPWSVYKESISTVNIENGVTGIGVCAFYECTKINNISIPSSVKRIGSSAFTSTAVSEAVIPDGVKSLGGSLFNSCLNLKSAKIPGSVYAVPVYAFLDADNLETVELGNGITEIQYRAFQSCTSLKQLDIPDSVTYIDPDVVSGCSNLTAINVASGNADYCSVDGVLFNKDKAKLIIAPETIEGTYTIPDTVQTIGYDAFRNCNKLTDIVIPSSVTRIEDNAFSSCDGIKSIIIPASVKYIGLSALPCENLESATFLGDAPEGGMITYSANAVIYAPKGNDTWTNSPLYDAKDQTWALIPIEFYDAPSCAHGSTKLVGAKDASCTEAGYRGDVVCDDCGAVIEKGEVIKALGHKTVVENAKVATCAEAGYTGDTVCTVCKDIIKKGEVIEALAHTVVTDAAVAPTCTETGLTEGSHCSVCKEVFVAQEVIEALGHKTVVENAKDATCTVAGYTGDTVCTVCKEIIETGKVVSKLGHSYGAWEVTTAPTCTAKGDEIRYCSRCDAAETRTIAALGHSYENGVCTVCGADDPNYVVEPVISLKNSSSSGKPTVSWAAVDNAVKYEVYRATSKTGTFKLQYTTTKTSYTNTGATAGYTYYYKVKAVAADGTKSDFSNMKYITCDCARPVVTIACTASSGKPKLTWDKVAGATKYEVYRATSKNGTYTKMYTTTGTSYTNTGATAGKTYYYKVKAICGKSSYGNSVYSTVKSITCDCARPVVKITTSNGDPKLSWSKVTGATKYEVYRATSKSGTYTKMLTTTKTSYTNTSAKAGKTYYYKVKAVCGASSYGNSAYSTVVSIKAK